MKRIILNLAATIDNYISRLDGSVDFLENPNDSPKSKIQETFNQFLKSIDIVIMGRTTYDEYNQYGWDYLKGKRIIVLSTRKGSSKVVEFYNGDLKELISNLNGNIWCFGGTKVIKSFMELNLIDEFQITTVPYILGKGKPLFEIGEYNLRLKLVKTIIDNDTITRIYSKK